MSARPFWLSAFLDFAPGDFERGVAFWSAVTGYAVSPPRGVSDEFATLVPRDGDDYLRVQRRDHGPTRIHLDLHVLDVVAATEVAEVLGASVAARPDLGYVVMHSPGGLTFCFVSHPASRVPAPATWPGVRHSRVYEVCLDVPPAAYDAECAFWAGLLGGTVEVLRRRPEFAWVRGFPTSALDLLLQRLADSATDVVSAHLDLGTTDRTTEVARHVGLGARVRAEEEFWTVLVDPAGLAYCVTDRDPTTGTLGWPRTPSPAVGRPR